MFSVIVFTIVSSLMGICALVWVCANEEKLVCVVQLHLDLYAIVVGILLSPVAALLLFVVLLRA